jgi:hypothetical protein
MEARQPSDSSLSELEIVVFSGMGVVVMVLGLVHGSVDSPIQ